MSEKFVEMLERIATLETALTAGFDQLAKRARSEEDQVVLRLMDAALKKTGNETDANAHSVAAAIRASHE